MLRRVLRIDEGLLALPSDTGYTLTVVLHGTPTAVISSE
jgi:hypothetical protein